jgi:hypothetical protein
MSDTRCALCGRVTRRGTTEHHLIPRTCHSNKWFKKRYTRQQMLQTIQVCRDCHHAIHDLMPDEKDLGRYHSTIESLQAHPEISKYLAWIKKRK